MIENEEMLLEENHDIFTDPDDFIEKYIKPIIDRKKNANIKQAEQAWNEYLINSFQERLKEDDLILFLRARFKPGIECLWKPPLTDKFIQENYRNFFYILSSQKQNYIKNAWDTHKDQLLKKIKEMTTDKRYEFLQKVMSSSSNGKSPTIKDFINSFEDKELLDKKSQELKSSLESDKIKNPKRINNLLKLITTRLTELNLNGTISLEENNKTKNPYNKIGINKNYFQFLMTKNDNELLLFLKNQPGINDSFYKIKGNVVKVNVDELNKFKDLIDFFKENLDIIDLTSSFEKMNISENETSKQEPNLLDKKNSFNFFKNSNEIETNKNNLFQNNNDLK